MPYFHYLTNKGGRTMLCSLSDLKDQDLTEIRSMESDLGVTLLAFSCHETSPAALDGDKLGKVQALEQKLGLALVAVEA
jgi:hypothetical protein